MGMLAHGGTLTGTGIAAAPVSGGASLVMSAAGVAEASIGAFAIQNAIKNFSKTNDGSNSGNKTTKSGGENKKSNEISFTQGRGNDAIKLTVELPKGFKQIKGASKGRKIYSDGKVFISPDANGHNGGVWKMGKTIKELAHKDTRMGTYDKNLNKIGD